MNDAVEDLIKAELSSESAPEIAQGELACLMRHFEEQKWRLDYTVNDAPIILTGTVPEISVRLYPYQVRQAFDEIFQDSFALILQRCKSMINIGKPFVVIFCGGSFCNPGLQREIEELMSTIQGLADEKGVDFRYSILSDFDHNW